MVVTLKGKRAADFQPEASDLPDAAYLCNATMHNKALVCSEQNANSAELEKHWCVCIQGGGGGMVIFTRLS